MALGASKPGARNGPEAAGPGPPSDVARAAAVTLDEPGLHEQRSQPLPDVRIAGPPHGLLHLEPAPQERVVGMEQVAVPVDVGHRHDRSGPADPTDLGSARPTGSSRCWKVAHEKTASKRRVGEGQAERVSAHGRRRPVRRRGRGRAPRPRPGATASARPAVMDPGPQPRSSSRMPGRSSGSTKAANGSTPRRACAGRWRSRRKASCSVRCSTPSWCQPAGATGWGDAAGRSYDAGPCRSPPPSPPPTSSSRS